MAWSDHDAARACITVRPHFSLETKVYIMFTTNALTGNQNMATPCFLTQLAPKGPGKAVLLAQYADGLYIHHAWRRKTDMTWEVREAVALRSQGRGMR